MDFRKFPSIDQFRHVVADITHKAEMIGLDAEGKPVYDKSRPKPSLTFKGTVKLHGTNGCVAFDLATGQLAAQSRERMLTPADDNHGFCAWVLSHTVTTALLRLRDLVLGLPAVKAQGPLAAVHIFGEWCGDQVNRKTAIGKLPVRWVVFGVRVTSEDGADIWLPVESVAAAWAESSKPLESLVNLHFISCFPTFELDVDFNHPADALDALERLTLQVEALCPVAEALGVAGLGEGIVWSVQDPVYGRHTFKTKGDKHKGTKNTRLVQIEPEVLASLEAFTDAVLTDSRLEQGLDLLEVERGKVTLDHVGDFLRWVGQDVLKEEADTLEASGLERKQVMGHINRQAKAWLMPRLAQF